MVDSRRLTKNIEYTYNTSMPLINEQSVNKEYITQKD